MERRAIIAALLMAALLIAYQTFFMQSTENPPPPPKAETPGTKPATAPAPAPAPTPAAAAPLAAPTVPDRTASVETPLYRAAISSRGGAITVWDVHFRGDRPMVLDGILGPSGIRVVAAGRSERPVQFRLSTESLSLGAQTPDRPG